MSKPSNKQRLWNICRQFIDEQRISCPEAVYQSDRVIENAYEFITRICEIVGFNERDD